jgi:hypothetical protein
MIPFFLDLAWTIKAVGLISGGIKNFFQVPAPVLHELYLWIMFVDVDVNKIA